MGKAQLIFLGWILVICGCSAAQKVDDAETESDSDSSTAVNEGDSDSAA